jgi:transcriptional regulator with XRE-family HTH domain
MNKTNDFINKVERTVAKRLKELRRLVGINKQELANKIGVSCYQLTKYEQSKNRISIGRLALMAKIMSVDLSYFISPELLDKLSSEEKLCNELLINFKKIPLPENQEWVLMIVKRLTGEEN